jgi:PEP-CTERM motif
VIFERANLAYRFQGIFKEVGLIMSKTKLYAALIAGSGLAVAAPAKAELVTYALSFSDGGSGTLTLTLPTGPIPTGDYNLFPGSIDTISASEFTSLTVSDDGYTFAFAGFGNKNGNLAGLEITNTLFKGINVALNGAQSAQSSKVFLSLDGNPITPGQFQIEGIGGSTVNIQGTFTAAAPIIAAVPEPSTWAMMILGFTGVGFMAYRRKQSGPSLRLA